MGVQELPRACVLVAVSEGIMNGATDAFSQVIEQAVAAGVRKALEEANDGTSTRRLLSVEQAATYLSLSKRELYNMIANNVLAAVKHGRRTMLDIRDLDAWIDFSKVSS
jgi:excisionase family DNA binding protein